MFCLTGVRISGELYSRFVSLAVLKGKCVTDRVLKSQKCCRSVMFDDTFLVSLLSAVTSVLSSVLVLDMLVVRRSILSEVNSGVYQVIVTGNTHASAGQVNCSNIDFILFDLH